jgi:hypothetical protein
MQNSSTFEAVDAVRDPKALRFEVASAGVPAGKRAIGSSVPADPAELAF